MPRKRGSKRNTRMAAEYHDMYRAITSAEHDADMIAFNAYIEEERKKKPAIDSDDDDDGAVTTTAAVASEAVTTTAAAASEAVTTTAAAASEAVTTTAAVSDKFTPRARPKWHTETSTFKLSDIQRDGSATNRFFSILFGTDMLYCVMLFLFGHLFISHGAYVASSHLIDSQMATIAACNAFLLGVSNNRLKFGYGADKNLLRRMLYWKFSECFRLAEIKMKTRANFWVFSPHGTVHLASSASDPWRRRHIGDELPFFLHRHRPTICGRFPPRADAKHWTVALHMVDEYYDPKTYEDLTRNHKGATRITLWMVVRYSVDGELDALTYALETPPIPGLVRRYHWVKKRSPAWTLFHTNTAGERCAESEFLCNFDDPQLTVVRTEDDFIAAFTKIPRSSS